MLAAAQKAEGISTEAVDHSIDGRCGAHPLNSVLAFLRVRAPPDHAVVVGERLAVPAQVLLEDQVVVDAVALGEELQDHGVWDTNIAALLLARDMKGLVEAAGNTRFKVVTPAVAAELVAAAQTESLPSLLSCLHSLFEITVAHDAGTVIVFWQARRDDITCARIFHQAFVKNESELPP